MRKPELSVALIQVLRRAAWQARTLGHSYVGTEHFLLSLLTAERAGGVLRSLGWEECTLRSVLPLSCYQSSISSIKTKCAYRLHAAERKIDTKVRNIRQQKCYNDLRKRRRSLAWHEQRASRLKNFALVSARKRAAGRNYSGFGFQTALSARNAAVRNITQFAGGTRSSAVPADTRLPSPQKPLCTARICP